MRVRYVGDVFRVGFSGFVCVKIWVIFVYVIVWELEGSCGYVGRVLCF